MEGKKYRSLLRRIVVIPMLIMLPLTMLTILVSLLNISATQEQMRQHELAGIRTVADQIDTTLRLAGSIFDEFIISNPDHKILQSYTDNRSAAYDVATQRGVMSWLKETVSSMPNVDGMFIAYPHLDHLVARSTSQGYSEIQQAIYTCIRQPNFQADSRWQMLNVGSGYLIKINKYESSYYGMWLSLPLLLSTWSLNTGNDGGHCFLTAAAIQGEGAELYYSFATGMIPVAGLPDGQALERDLAYDNDGFQMGLTPSDKSLWSSLPIGSRVMLLACLAAILLTPFVVLWLYLRIAKPLRTLSGAMERIGGGDTSYRIPVRELRYVNEFDALNDRFNQMLDATTHLERNLYETRLQHERSKLQYISRQIRPHFILNALNLIYTYEPEEHELTRKMVRYLSDYFRYIVNLQHDLVPLEEECLHTKRYLEIQRERYPDRFRFAVEWEARVSDVLIPPLVIQTFVENSIKYGLKNDRAIYIYVMAREENGCLNITIGDTGVGIPQAILNAIHAFLETRVSSDELGIGIQNTIERMDIIYGQRVGLVFENAEEGGTHIVVRVPILREEEADAEFADGG